jgi:hypothetical protein
LRMEILYWTRMVVLFGILSASGCDICSFRPI